MHVWVFVQNNGSFSGSTAAHFEGGRKRLSAVLAASSDLSVVTIGTSRLHSLTLQYRMFECPSVTCCCRLSDVQVSPSSHRQLHSAYADVDLLLSIVLQNLTSPSAELSVE